MSLRICLGLVSVVLLSSMGAACGRDDVMPPLDVDAATSDLGGADAGPRDAAFDANTIDAAECPDVDGDGYRAAPCGDDCDDDDASRYPGATEICDGDDEDCDDTTHGVDADGDTFVSVACCNGAGNCGTDCDDTDSTVHPGVSEVCNGGIDDDCNGLADLADSVCVPCGDGLTGFDGECTDVNECTAGAPCGGFSGTTCENTYGSYVCHCPSGYTAPAAGGTCVDLNECDLGTCGTGMATCVNSVGSFACTCNAGYTVVPGGGAPCVDIDECAAGTPCGAGLGTCENRDGTYACVSCSAGYTAPATGGTCTDINECALGTDDCDAPSSTCTNRAGAFTCGCLPGFTGTGRGATGCGPRFTDLGGGLVRDNNGSGLVWQQAVPAGDYTQAGAIAYCAGLALDGGGWRLPTIDELMSIVDMRFSPTIDPTYFPGTPTQQSWSSSSVAGSPSYGWHVYFDFGGAGSIVATSFARARCVR